MNDAKIKNMESLATTDKRVDALSIVEAGLQAIDTRRLLEEAISIKDGTLCVGTQTCSIEAVERVFFVGIGKCAHQAAEIVEEKCGEILAGGIAIDVHVPEVCKTQKIKCIAGTHPEPSPTNIEVSREIVALLSGLNEKDAVIVVVSGGGSTLLCLPSSGKNTCVEENLILETLFRKGAPIREINTVRKHMSEARGGFLAKHAYPAQVFGLIFSDVPGNDVSFIASGPTVKDETTIDDALGVLTKYSVQATCGIEDCGLIETPKDDKYFARVSNTLLASNVVALSAMKQEAEKRGYRAEIISDALEGEAQEVGVQLVKKIQEVEGPVVHLYGGETTVTFDVPGDGGRNQEVALSAVRAVTDSELLISVASDGHDHGVFAGAIADTVVREKADRLGLVIGGFLEKHNERMFYEQTEDYIFTGHTGSNVSDLLVVLKK